MLSGVVLALSELLLELIARHGLGRRVCDHGGERQMLFLFADDERSLLVWLYDRLGALRWLNRRGESSEIFVPIRLHVVPNLACELDGFQGLFRLTAASAGERPLCPSMRDRVDGLPRTG
jgi:hypothetical protein